MAEVHIVDIDGEQWDIKDLPLTTKVNLLGDTAKIKAIGESYITQKNNIFRGKCLNGSTDVQYPVLPFGNSPTLSGGGYSIAQILEKIADGSFDDIYIGDYILDENNNLYRIAGLDTERGRGDTSLIAHHAVMVPDRSITNMNWNTTKSTVGGYQSSAIQSYCDNDGKTLIESIFGEAHVLSVRDRLSSAINETIPSSGYAGKLGCASALSWSTHKVRLMSEIELLGTRIWSGSFDIGTAGVQLPLFRLEPRLILGLRYEYWLSGIASSTEACSIHRYGYVNAYFTTDNIGVRPRFLIG